MLSAAVDEFRLIVTADYAVLVYALGAAVLRWLLLGLLSLSRRR